MATIQYQGSVASMTILDELLKGRLMGVRPEGELISRLGTTGEQFQESHKTGEPTEFAGVILEDTTGEVDTTTAYLDNCNRNFCTLVDGWSKTNQVFITNLRYTVQKGRYGFNGHTYSYRVSFTFTAIDQA